MMLGSPPGNSATSLAKAGVHPPLRPRVTIFLTAGRRYPAAACLAFTRSAAGAIVLRREAPARLVRDDVLARAGHSDAKWVGHWLIRLDALAGRVGCTRAIILDGEWRPDLDPHLAVLRRAGTQFYFSPSPFLQGEAA
jgi:hypothetical protein